MKIQSQKPWLIKVVANGNSFCRRSHGRREKHVCDQAGGGPPSNARVEREETLRRCAGGVVRVGCGWPSAKVGVVDDGRVVFCARAMLLFPGAFVVGAAFAWAVGWADLRPWRRAAAAHWTERARLLFRARTARQTNVVLIGVLLLIASAGLTHGRSTLPAFFGGMLGGLIAGWPLDRAVDPSRTLGAWMHLMAVSLVLSVLRFATVGLAAVLMPRRIDGVALIITGLFLVLQVALELGLQVRLLVWFRLLRPAGAALRALVAEVATELGVRVRATWELRVPYANAVAFITTRELAFTSKLLAIASDGELRAVCAHELGHLGESRWTVFGRVCGSLQFLPLIFLAPMFSRFGPSGLAMAFVAVAIIVVLRARLRRAMEKRADRVASAADTGNAVYAHALEKIYRANHLPAVLGKRTLRPHPDLYDRMLAAGVTPDYPRPAPPPRIRWSSAALMVASVIAAVWFGLTV